MLGFRGQPLFLGVQVVCLELQAICGLQCRPCLCLRGKLTGGLLQMLCLLLGSLCRQLGKLHFGRIL